MEQEFEAQAYDAVCRAMGEAVWQLIATGQVVSREAIARMLSSYRNGDQTWLKALRYQYCGRFKKLQRTGEFRYSCHHKKLSISSLGQKSTLLVFVYVEQ